MNTRKILGLVLLAAGILALVYGGFTYTTTASEAELGPFELRVKERQRVSIPVWAGVGLAAAGGLVLATGKK